MKKTTREWVKKAEEDYLIAKQGSRSKVPLHDGVCFHCQQCAEKYLKGLLEELGLAVRKTHNRSAAQRPCAALSHTAVLAARIGLSFDFCRAPALPGRAGYEASSHRGAALG